ncbi:hypothetical protein [Desulfitobacterium hafniense]|uniref:hypothetical protein n=1 Tax=Desulfitobacterium hafniense TaxID=49338 RepID=UPI00059BC241|nr:hypothetical protein [Desulfitobacterium hafniense]
MGKVITFRTEDVRAIIDGKKTATRIIIKPQPTYHYFLLGRITDSTGDKKRIGCAAWGPSEEDVAEYAKIPYEVGDILWVREKWTELDKQIHYAADGCPDIDRYDPFGKPLDGRKIKWKSPICMPRDFARIFLGVESVSAGRLQDITEEGAKAEGFIGDAISPAGKHARSWFRNKWDEDYWEKGFPWDRNPWVWVIEFERLDLPF